MALTAQQVVALTPVSAWVLVADEATYPSDEVLAEMAAGVVPAWCWPAPPQARPGDLLLFYFMAPLTGVRFAARVASRPFADEGLAASTGEDAATGWVTHTPLVAVPPVSFGDLSDAAGGRLTPRAGSRHYLGPDGVRALLAAMERDGGEPGAEVRDVVVVPSGAATPIADAVEIDAWRALAPGAVEEVDDVDTHVVGPLLRLVLPEGHVVRRRYSVPGIGVADHAVTRDDVPVAVVVSSAALLEPTSGSWSGVADHLRLEHLVRALRVPGLLVDANRVLLVSPDALGPVSEVDRVLVREGDLRRIAAFLVPGSQV